MNHDYLMQFSDPSPRLYSHLHLHAISLCSTLLSSFHFSLHSPTHSAQLLTPLLTLHSTAAQTYLTETVRQLKTRTCSPPRQTKPCSSSPGTPAASLILHCTFHFSFSFVLPFSFSFCFPFSSSLSFHFLSSLHYTSLRCCYLAMALFSRLTCFISILLILYHSSFSLHLTSPHLVSSHLISPLSLSPPLSPFHLLTT